MSRTLIPRGPKFHLHGGVSFKGRTSSQAVERRYIRGWNIVSHICETNYCSSCECRFEQRLSRVKTITLQRNHFPSLLFYVLLLPALQSDTNHWILASLATLLATAMTSILGSAAQHLRAWFHSWDLWNASILYMCNSLWTLHCFLSVLRG